MNAWPRRLTLMGLLLIFTGFVFALFFSWSVDHQPRLVSHDAYQPLFEAIISGGNGANEHWREIEDEISRNSVLQRRAADVHGHSVNMGILMILVGLLAPLATRNMGAADYRLLLAMAVTSVVYPVGLFLQFLGLNPGGEVVSAIGAAGAVTTLAMLYLRLSKAVDSLVD
jgi:hypothetical protein